MVPYLLPMGANCVLRMNPSERYLRVLHELLSMQRSEPCLSLGDDELYGGHEPSVNLPQVAMHTSCPMGCMWIGTLTCN